MYKKDYKKKETIHVGVDATSHADIRVSNTAENSNDRSSRLSSI